jgi:histidine triad (HIT) family protein
LDIHPTSNGHILIIPKKHYNNILDIDLEALNHINVITKKMYKHLSTILNLDGITISQNNGYGQDIKHYHVHMIPKYKDNPPLKDINEIYELLKQ